jgi:hypothetical protein
MAWVNRDSPHYINSIIKSREKREANLGGLQEENKMKKKWILLGTALILFSIAINVHAQTLEGEFQGITFQGETIESTFLLCNESSSGENFNVSSSNPWMQLRPLSVYVAGDSCEKIYAFITPSPYAEAGLYEIEVNAKSERLNATRTFYLTVAQGHKIEINALKKSITTTQCQQKEFQFELTNTGIFDEKALISVEGINPNWIELSSEELFLPRNESREIEATVLIPCNQEPKKYEFSIAVQLKNTSVTAKETVSLNVENGQEISIEGKEFTACNDLKTASYFVIENKGILEDEITINLKGEKWISIKEEKLLLQPQEKKEIGIEFNETEMKKGIYPFTIEVYSEKFNQLYTKELTVDLQDCLNLSIENALRKDSACIEFSPEISYIIKNNGTKRIKLDLSIQGIKAELEKNSVALSSGEAIEVKAKLDLKGETPGKKSFAFIAESENYSQKKENSIELEDCYNAEIIPPSIEVCKGVPLKDKKTTIKNTGTKKQFFNVSFDVQWISLEEKSFELEGSQEKTIALNVVPPLNATESSYSIKAETEDSIYSATGKINYLNEKECFGIAMTNLKKAIDVNAGEGAITTIKVTNNGKTEQNVSFSVEEYDWVYFNPKQLHLNQGETKEIYVYFNPPFDFKQEKAKVKLKAKTNFGFKAQEEIELNIFGGSIVLTINPEDIKVKPIELETEDTKEKEVEIKIEIENNTETSIKVIAVKLNYPESTYFIEEPVIKKGEKEELILKFVARKELDLNGLEVPVEIITDKGTYNKIIKLQGKKTEEKETTKETTTGFVLFGEDEYILVILIVIVVILIIMAAVRDSKEEEEKIIDYGQQKDFQEEIKEIITKKPKTKKRKQHKRKGKKK